MIKLGIVMDPISSINLYKNTSFAILLAAQNRGYQIYYMEMSSLYIRNNEARASSSLLSVKTDGNDWYRLQQSQDINLRDLDVIFMRKDPPFDMEFIYATYILELAENNNTLIVNKPQSLRDCNEKIFIAWFSKYMPNTLVSRSDDHIRSFLQEHGDIIIKPLDSMGGHSIFRINQADHNISVIIETMTNYGKHFCMVQKYLPAIQYGDKRVLIVDGEAVPYCLVRLPKSGETRANLAAGGRGEVHPLSTIELTIVQDVAPVLKEKGLMFVGLDIIGNNITEINVTSPTCVREIEAAYHISITSMILDAIEKRLTTR